MQIVRIQREDSNILWCSRDAGGPFYRIEGSIFGDFSVTDEAVTGRLLSPLDPPNILCTGLNYRQHAEETKATPPLYPVLFMKATSSVIGAGEAIVIPRHLPSERVDFECELAAVIGKKAKNVPKEAALDYVLGYTCANDVSARDWQIKYGGSQWCRGKTFDTFCPLGPWIVTKDEIPDPQALDISTVLNGETMQSASTADMLFSVAELIEFFSGSTTLLPGTVILTGTPSGVGMARRPPRWLHPGDTVTVKISGIGELTNPVAAEFPV